MGVRNALNFIGQGQREANFPHLHNALDRHLKMISNVGIGGDYSRYGEQFVDAWYSWNPLW